MLGELVHRDGRQIVVQLGPGSAAIGRYPGGELRAAIKHVGVLDILPAHARRTDGQVGRHGLAVVNGPEDDDLDWCSIDWHTAEDDVRRLRQRIFTASKEGDLRKVRNLQKLMLRSRANALVSVRRVTEVNTGRKTPGVDGKVIVTASGKAFMANALQHDHKTRKPLPVKRVYIPKANKQKRPLGIPAIVDRGLQALVVNALEPEWEARFEPKSYGFRPGRGCHDAIESIFKTLAGPSVRRPWILDADLAAAFDRIDHNHLLQSLGSFPARGLVEGWLKAGVIENGRLAPTEEGTPQGSLCVATHNPPYEQRWVMRSVDRSVLVRKGTGAEHCT